MDRGDARTGIPLGSGKVGSFVIATIVGIAAGIVTAALFAANEERRRR